MDRPAPRLSQLLLSVLTAYLLFAAVGGLSSAKAEVIAGNGGGVTGSVTVTNYPAVGTNFVTWFGSGYPGPGVQYFTVPGANYTLNSVTLQMGNASNPAGDFSLGLYQVSVSGGNIALGSPTTLSGTADPATAGTYTYTGTASLLAGQAYLLIAQVATAGSSYTWNKTNSGNGVGFLIMPGLAGFTITDPLDLSKDLVFFIEAGAGLIFSVDATRVGGTAAAQSGSTGGGTTAQEPTTLLLTDLTSIGSAIFSSLPTALAQRDLALGGSQTTLRDFGSRLFRLRAGTTTEEDRTETGEGDGTEQETVMVGEGDGVPARGGKSTKVVMNKVNPEAYAWEVFTSFDYGTQDLDAQKNFLGLQTDTYAETIGIERALGEHLHLGAGVSYLESFSDQSTDLDGVTLATYLSGTWGGLYADVLYGATLLDHDIDRSTGLGSTAHAAPDSTVHAVNFNTGYNFHFGNWRTGPFAGVDYAHAKIDGYTEDGGGTAATEVSEQSLDSLITRLGWQASYRKKTSWGAITPQLRLGWERENQDGNDPVTVGLVKSPYYILKGNTLSSTGAPFGVTVSGYDRERDAMTVGAALSVDIGRRFNITLDYEGYFLAEGYSAHFGKLMMGWKF